MNRPTNIAACCIALCLIGACRDPRRLEGHTQTALPEGLDSSNPVEVATAALDACQSLAELGLDGLKDEQRRDAYTMAQSHLFALADRDAIYQTWARAWGRIGDKPHLIARRVDEVIKSWPSTVARYAGHRSGEPVAAARHKHSYPRPLDTAIAPVSELVVAVEAEDDLAGNVDSLQREEAIQVGKSPDGRAVIYVGLIQDKNSSGHWLVVSIGIGPRE